MDKGKTWDEYTKEEQANLLNHWYVYYGGLIVTLAEIDKFHELSLTHQDDIFNYILSSFIANNTIQSSFLTVCMRDNRLDELFENVVKYDDLTEDDKERINPVRQFILDEIVNTYLNPNK
jgi:hypothetical protein